MDRTNVAGAYSADGPAPDLMGQDQTQQTSAGFFIDESPTLTAHKPDSINNKSDFSSAASSNQKTPASASTITEEHTAHFDAYVLPKKPQRTQPLNFDIPPGHRTHKLDQPDEASMIDNKNNVINKNLKRNSKPSNEVMHTNNLPPTSPTEEYLLENTLEQRIHAMLKRLTDNPSSTASSPDQNEQRQQSSNTLLSNLHETKNPLSNSNASLEPAPASSVQTPQEENNVSENQAVAEHNSQLEAPPWLADMASQLSQRLQEKETQAEAVINVTIGRVEVRAVQAETPKSVRHTSKLTGVMTLDDYLKRRDNRGAK